MTASTIVALDTETTSLRPDRRAWEIGLIVRRPGQPDTAHGWFIDAEDLDLGNADPFSLRIGRFYERHPQFNRLAHGSTTRELLALEEVEELTRGAHLLNKVVGFDADVLGQRMRAKGILPSWDYHLIEVESMAVGWLARKAQMLREQFPDTNFEPWPPLPWKSDDLARALGVELPGDDERHTALGDARLALAMYDAMTRGLNTPVDSREAAA